MQVYDICENKLPRRKQRGIENRITTYYAASGGEFNPEFRLKALMTVPVFTGCLLWSTFSNADSLIIWFGSGKTQQVTLKEPVDAVVNIQAQSTGTESGETAHNVRFRELYNNQSTRKESDAAQNKKAAQDKKSSYHLKWGSPKSGE